MAIQFDGIDEYVDFGATDMPAASDQATWMLWGYLDASQTQELLSKANGTGNAAHLWAIGVTTQEALEGWVRTTNTTNVMSSNGAVPLGAWFHAAVTYDGADVRLYLDGVEVDSAAQTGDIAVDAGIDFWLGGNPTSPTSRPFAGRMADVRVYGRALAASEIATIVTCRGADAIRAGLIGRARCLDGTRSAVVTNVNTEGTVVGSGSPANAPTSEFDDFGVEPQQASFGERDPGTVLMEFAIT